MNCSKEQPGSIVNKTLKNGISILKDPSKESDSYADFKYIGFTNLVLLIKSYEPEKIYLILENRGETHKSHRILTKITPSHSAYQRALL